MLTIALYVILSTLQSQTPSGLQKQASHPSHWEFQIFCQEFYFFFHLVGNLYKFPLSLQKGCFILYMCIICSTKVSRLPGSIASHLRGSGVTKSSKERNTQFNKSHMLLFTPVIFEHEQQRIWNKMIKPMPVSTVSALILY